MNHLQSVRITVILAGLLLLGTPFSIAQYLSPEDLQSAFEIRHDLYGFNGEYMMDECYESDDPYSNPPQPFTSIYLSSSCRELVEEVRPGIVRFPGGITANFYHFYGTGYGIRLSETWGNAIGPVNPYLDQLMPVNFIELFADLVLQTNSKVIFTLNLYTHFNEGGDAVSNPASTAYLEKLQENMAALQYLIDRGVELVGIELGNEMYSYSELTGLLNLSQGPSNYLAIAENYSDSIRARFPGIPIGIPIAIHRGFGQISWNLAMQEADFAEGRVIHEYERIVFDQCEAITDRDAYFTCAREKVELFFDTDFQAAMEEYMQLYPEKELWLTEWGMSQAHKVANTFFDAYYSFKYWNRLMEFEHLNPNAVSYALRHNLISGGWSYSAFSKKFADESDNLYYNGNKTIHASAYAHKLMKDVFDGGHSYVGQTRLSECDAWIYRKDNGDLVAAFINETAEPRTIDVQALADELGLTGLDITSYSALYADAFSDAAGINHWGGALPLENHLTYRQDELPLSPDHFQLDRLGLVVLQLQPVIPDPAITSITVSQRSDCTIDVAWTVSHEQLNGHYAVSASFNNTGFYSVGTVYPTGTGTNVLYQFNYDPVNNGAFDFHVERILNAEVQSASPDSSISIACVSDPDPYLISFRAFDEEDCSIDLNWQVGNESATGHYLVLMDDGSAEPQELALVPSSGNGFLASYNVAVYPEFNGDHQFLVRRFDNMLPDFNSNPLMAVVECIPEAAASFAGFTVSTDPDCTTYFDWQVANEDGAAEYEIQKSLNDGPYSTLAVIPAHQAAELAEYHYGFHPESGGEYRFRIDRVTADAIVLPSEVITQGITCPSNAEPQFTAFYVAPSTDGTCAVDVSWSVSDENASGNYKIFHSVNNAPYELAATEAAAGNLAAAGYSVQVPVQSNGMQRFQVVRFKDGQAQISTPVSQISIGCTPPGPAGTTISDFYTYLNSDCQVVMTWTALNQLEHTEFVLMASPAGPGPPSSVQLATIPSTGNGSDEYTYVLPATENGEFVFEIEIIESGSSVNSYSSGITEIDCVPIPEISLEVGSNTTFNVLQIIINSNMPTAAEMSVVHTVTGVTAIQEALNLVNGVNIYTYELDEIPQANGGPHHVILQWSGGTITEMFIYID